MPQLFPYPEGTPCSRCRGELPPDRKHRYCAKCARAYARERRLRPGQRAVAVAHHRRLTYGMSPEEYAALLSRQGGVCASCLEPETATRRGIAKTLAVDHDHRSGAIRGLLCTRCNTALGLLRDDPARIAALLRYREDAS